VAGVLGEHGEDGGAHIAAAHAPGPEASMAPPVFVSLFHVMSSRV
jgi:hypothetical protein